MNQNKTTQKTLKRFSLGLGLSLLVSISSGCGSIGKSAPHSGLGIVANLDREDVEIIRTVEGESTKQSLLLGSIQVIDGDKYKILWIPFFQDKGAGELQSNSTFLGAFTLAFAPVSVIDRAYYDALAETPDADTVFYKTSTQERRGFPLLYTSERVTLRGKAAKVKSD
ncbi:hypothetical protein N8737_02265 [Verrucomicrobia bacterium]|jgi:hypothetical protein|nr:hypothetical protein [Verrucomicrobiota bacterium]MDA7510756.1 hypothetical protein [Verrucomicrobiota bacterium]MDA7657505.1 hypothetical protein [Verrucomicrobiota bacterium]MDB4746284.1 hypothetical protein [Verrucomicrobiota bacterium]